MTTEMNNESFPLLRSLLHAFGIDDSLDIMECTIVFSSQNGFLGEIILKIVPKEVRLDERGELVAEIKRFALVEQQDQKPVLHVAPGIKPQFLDVQGGQQGKVTVSH